MAIALAVWTLFVWATRIRNVVASDGSVGELLVPVGLTVLAVVALIDRRRGGVALAAATIGVWGVRLPLVLVHDHSAGFKIVHAALAAISIALAVAVLRSVRRRQVVPASPSSR